MSRAPRKRATSTYSWETFSYKGSGQLERGRAVPIWTHFGKTLQEVRAMVWAPGIEKDATEVVQFLPAEHPGLNDDQLIAKARKWVETRVAALDKEKP